MPAGLITSRAAGFVGFGVVVVAAVVILATGSSIAYFGPALVGGAAFGTLVALLLPPNSVSRPDS